MKFDANIYDLIQETRIEELKSDGYLLKHKKSGARVLILANDDDNKVFSIGFRTPPPDSTGVPHILEHSVLCGSDKYPVKDPFMELVKGSLNTFLNAMTYPDKTMYPVASCNDKDFKNLMDVYMDAVFHPSIYSRKQIFMQEGWHYELESEDGELTYNGVVYNEMKGAFSSPDDVLSRHCLNSLYPDTSYSTESGGDPECIPDLSYEKFLSFHKKLYHPSNSYIYLYGDCDMTERLEYLDREYLSKYDYDKIDSEIAIQKPFDKMAVVEKEYSVTEDEGTDNRTYLAYNLSVGDTLDKKLYLALQIIDYALFSTAGAPVKQALIDSGIGEDILCSYESELRQPMFTIVAKNTEANKAEEFLSIIKNTITEIAKNGINKDTLLAGINYNEFRYREADFGSFPKGLLYGLNLMDSWLYDETKPFIHLAQNETYEFLKNNIDTGYFEDLLRRFFIENTHTSLVILRPSVGLTEKNDRATANKLAAYKASLSPEQIRQIVEETKELKQYQSEPSTDEELKSIPMLSREDIKKDIEPLSNNIEKVNSVKIDHHNIYTNGIGYLSMYFNMNKVATEDLLYVGLLNIVLGYIDTEKRSFDELSNMIDIHTGGIGFSYDAYTDAHKNDETEMYFTVKCKALANKFTDAFELIREILFQSKYKEYKRLKEIIAETKAKKQSSFVAAGHSTAIGLCGAQFATLAKYGSYLSGIELYNFITDLYENFEDKKEEIAKGLERVCRQIIVKENLIISFTGDDEVYGAVKPQIVDFINTIPDENLPAVTRNFVFENKNIGYKTSSQVNYVARCGDFRDAGLEYDSALSVLKTILSSDYLWNNVRVLGGAYGCMNAFGRTGQSYFVSYRDPNVADTNKVFEGIPEYIRNFNVTEREMTKYILGTFSSADTPMNAAAKGDRSFGMMMRGITEEQLREERARMLNVQQKDINGLEPYIQAVLDGNHIAVVGSSEKIQKDAELFDEVRNLL